MSDVRHLLAAMQPDTEAPPPPSIIVQGGSPKEFRQAAKEAVEKAAWVLKQRAIVGDLRHVPTDFPLTNVYLSRQLEFLGFTPALDTPRRALRRRKRIFTLYNDVYWGITFNRERDRAVAHHRSGFRVRFIRR